jgi:NDP-sugar pyrophosphorylase family protein
MTLTYSTEPAPLGTGGAVRLALPVFRESTVLLLNGDSFCDVDLAALVAFHRDRGGVTLTLADVPDASRYGRVLADPDGRVRGFVEKGGDHAPGRINAGVYVFDRDLLAAIPPDHPVSLEREVLPDLVAAGRVRGFPGGRFIDIGTPESYAAADAFFAAAQGRSV